MPSCVAKARKMPWLRTAVLPQVEDPNSAPNFEYDHTERDEGKVILFALKSRLSMWRARNL